MKNVLIAGCPDVVTAQLKKYAAEKGVEFAFVDNLNEIVQEASKKLFDVVVLNVLLEKISAYRMIEKIRSVPDFNPKILLFSYFVRIDQSENSAMHGFYSHFVETDFKDDKNPPYYLGAFSRSSAEELFLRAIERFIK